MSNREERPPPVAVVIFGDSVLVMRRGQEPLVVPLADWRRFLADVRAGRHDRPWGQAA